MNLGLRGKIMTMVVGILLFSLGLNSFINIVSFRGEYKQALYDNVFEVGAQIQNSMRDVLNLGLNIRQLEGMNDLCVNTLKSHPDLGYVFVVDLEGEIIYHSAPKSIGGVSRDVVGLNALQATESFVQAYKDKVEGVGYFDVAMPIFGMQQERVGTIRLGLLAETIDKKVNRMILVSVSLSLVALLIAIVSVIIFVIKVVSRPLNQVVDMFGKIAQGGGDLTKKISVASRDEIGQLASLFNKFVSTLHNMVSQVRNTSDKVNISSQNLSTTAQQMNTTSVDISNTIQQVSKGVSKQASKVESTVKIMEDMSSSVKQVASNVQTAAASSEKATNTAQEGGKLAGQAVERISIISEVIGSSAEVVKRFVGRSKQISEIVNVLTTIADQTNLLALNAAIEAARAGETGRGFAVVAEEVRKLAEGSAASAKDIGKLVSDIQSETSNAVSAMERGTREISQGTTIVNEVGRVLNQIVEANKEVSRVVNEIASASLRQLDGTKKVVEAVNEISTISEESASAAEEATSSTQEQTASMQEMASSAQELSRMALDLKDLVAKFKL
ncbi:MAG: methyl-accepting chemotaxis protein [Candidatus Omnitrophota bacterium]